MTLASGDVDIADTVRKFRESHPDGFYPEFQVIDKPISIPRSRQFRDAWKLTGTGKIEVDKAKAEVIHMQRIREFRNKKLEDLDKESLRYITDKVELDRIEQQKQKLRDIPQSMSKFNLTNPEWPFSETDH